MSAIRTSRAVFVQPGGTVALQEFDLRPLQPDEVLVRTAATPIHPADLNAIEGKYPGTPEPPFVSGREGAGFVEEIGAAVTALQPGDLVLLPPEGGTWREHSIHAAAGLLRVPSSLAPEQAALLRVNPGTALCLLRDFASLAPGEWIVQNAGNSAVGRAICQLARHFGWHTASLVRDPAALDPTLRETGDVFLADTAASDLRAAAGVPVRLAFNAVGGESALRLANALADSGTLVTYGAMARQPLRLPNGLLIFRDLSFRGFWLKRWSDGTPPAIQRAMLAELSDLAAAGVVQSQIAGVYPLAACAEAVAHAARAQRGGKILFGAGG